MDFKGIAITAITMITAGTIAYVAYKTVNRTVKKEVA
jgi:hypothetical protein